MNFITYDDKEELNSNSVIPSKNKIMASDMNMIKDVVNQLSNTIGNTSNLNTVNKDNLVNAINEVNYKKYNLQTDVELETSIQVNGKTVYKRIFSGDLVNASSSSQPLFNFDFDFDDIWIDEANSYIYNENEVLSLNWFYLTNDYCRIWINKTQKAIRIKTGNDLSSMFDYKIVLSYTKN